MAYVNNSGQVRVGVRSMANSPVVTPTISASLLQSLFGVWNGDTLGTTLDSSIYGAWSGDVLGTSLDTSIYAVYNAENNANDSFGTKHGTLVNGTTFSTGKLGQAFSFDGVNDYIKLPSNSLSFTEDFSVSFWLKLGSLGQSSYIIDSAGFSGIGTTGWVLNLTSGNLNFTIHNNNSMQSLGANYILTSTSVWYHVVITSKSGYNAIYINNSLITSNTSTMRPNYVSSSYDIPYIGVFKTGNYQFFQGNIDSLTIWQKELTVGEISSLYNSGNGAQYPFSSQTLPSSNDSVGTNHGTLVGGMTYVDGKNGKAFQFNGANAYVSFPTNSWNSLVGTDLTISLWVKFASTGDQTLVSNMSSPSINVWSGWEIRLVGGRPTIYMWNNSGTGVGAQGGVISTNTWYHIVATRKKGSRTRIYINGSLVQTDTNTPDPSISGTYYPNIGHLQYSSTYHGLYTTSGTLIDSVNLWSKEISADEVVQLYNGGNGTQYPYSSQTLPSVANQLGVDNGTLMNGCTFGDGKIGKAFQFDGVNDLVELPTNSCNFSGDFSYSFWFNLASTGGYPSLISNYRNAGGDFGYFIRMNPSNKIEVWGYANSTPSFSLATLTTFSTNTWYHVSVTKSSSSVKIYVNGTLDRTTSVGVPIVYFSTMYTAIGCLYKWNGSSSTDFVSNGSKIDAVNVWQKELTQSEVTELYNSGNGKQITTTPIVTSGLVLNLDSSRTSSYPNSGTTWFDISGNGNNGTMMNGVGYSSLNSVSLTFDQINDYISLPNMSTYLMNKSKFTYETWIKVNNPAMADPYLQTLFSFGNSGQYSNDIMFFITSNSLNIQINNGADGGCSLPYSSTSWNNVCVVYDGTQTVNSDRIKVYINGTLQTLTTTYTIPSTTANINTTNCGIGAYSCNNFANCHFGGNIGSARLYTTSLIASEVTQNFNATKSRFGL